MKRFIQWLARVFNAEITKEVVVERVVEKEVVRYLTEGGTIEGDVTIDGDVVVNGYLHVRGSVACKEVFNDSNM